MEKSTGIPAGATVTNKAGTGTRKMQKSRFIDGMAVIAAISLVTFLFSKYSKSVGVYGKGTLLVVFAGVVAAIKYLEKVGLEKAKRGKDADRGADAEEAVGAILDRLPEGNFVIHDFASGKGNIDHILMCTKGILTLQTKSHAGKVSFDGNKLLRNGRKFEKDFLNQAWAQCYLVKEVLAKRGITNLHPEPVILFTKAAVQVRGKAGGIDIVGIKDFSRFLKLLPDRISVPEAGRIYNRLKAASTS